MHVITMLVLISILIIVHELGHFIAARIFGVRVAKFALGLPFGPTLYRRKFGNTEFLIHSFLLGGYIAFPDDNEDEKKANEENGKEPELPLDSPERFKNKNGLQQAIIISAGVFANVVFAIFLVFATALHYQKLPSGNSEVYIKEIVVQNNSSNILEAGAENGDLILQINGKKINSTYKLISTIKENTYPKSMNITILRDGKNVELKNVQTNKDGLLGIKLEAKEVFVKTNTPKQALKYSYIYIVDNTKTMVIGLLQLVTGKIPMKEMHGIVAITKIGGDIIEHQGLLNGLLLTAIISIDLAIINLLPIPALDGGHLMFLAIEKISRRKLDEKVMEKINSAFFFALLLLMVFIVFNDIFALITKKF